MRIDRDAWRPAPWGADQGVTHEIWRLDDGAPGYRVRVSVAEIARSGPFTSMPGYRRWLAVLDEGAGLTLRVGGYVMRGVRGEGTELDGNVDVVAIVESRARVFNLIARAEETWTARWAAAGDALILPPGITIVHGGGVAIDGAASSLAPDGTVVFDGERARHVEVREPAIVVHVVRAAGR